MYVVHILDVGRVKGVVVVVVEEEEGGRGKEEEGKHLSQDKMWNFLMCPIEKGQEMS